MQEQFKPLFKENEKQQFVFEELTGKWEKATESTISSLWFWWSTQEGAHRFEDEEGFTVFGIKKNLPE